MILKTEKTHSFYICKTSCRACKNTLDQPVKEVIPYLPKNFIGIDIGAHIGAWGILLQDHCNRFYSFEPNIECYKVLEKNAESHSCIKPTNLAIWNKKTELNSFTENPLSYQAHTYDYLPDKCSSFSIKIKADKLDNLINEKIDFIKIDAEGSEVQILEGAVDLLTKYKPILLVEFCKEHITAHKKNPKEFFILIGKCGYQVNGEVMEESLNGKMNDITNIFFM